MKKPTIAIVITLFIIMLVGILYINKSYNLKKNLNNQNNKAQVTENDGISSSQADDIIFGEYKYFFSDSDTISAKYMKSGQNIKIYSLYPIDNKSKYDISPNGSVAAYISKDGQLWVLYNDGTKKKIIPDKYGTIDNSIIKKEKPEYIWADNPVFAQNSNIRFISDLPEALPSLRKSIWEVDLNSNNMQKIYTPVSEVYRFMGYGDSGKYMILDGDNIVVIDKASNSSDNIDVRDKYIISLSLDGTKIIFVYKNKNNVPDFSNMYVMSNTGSNSTLLSGALGYISTDMGVWFNDGSRYAFIIKSVLGAKDKIAVIDFREGFSSIKNFDTGSDINFLPGCKLSWTGDESISVDIGDDVIDVDLK